MMERMTNEQLLEGMKNASPVKPTPTDAIAPSESEPEQEPVEPTFIDVGVIEVTETANDETAESDITEPQITATPEVAVVPNPYAELPTERIDISNAEFIAAVFRDIPENASAAVCTKPGQLKKDSSWRANRASPALVQNLSPDSNNYVNCSSFYPGDDQSFYARKEKLAAMHMILLDDIGTKVPFEKLNDFKLTSLIETSPGNYQGLIALKEPIDETTASNIVKLLAADGFSDPGAGGANRWVRLPIAINGKEKHRNENGEAFRCKLVEWNPNYCYTPQEIIDGLGLKPPTKSVVVPSIESENHHVDEIFTRKPITNPVLVALKAGGFYKKHLGGGKHDVICPWVHEHTDQLDSGSAYFVPSEDYPLGGYCCQHSHREQYRILELLKHLDIPQIAARGTAIIQLKTGETNRIIRAAEDVLAATGRYYRAGSVIVQVLINADSVSVVPVNESTLYLTLSAEVTWCKYDGRSKKLEQCDPLQKHVKLLCESQSGNCLPLLHGVARQPYFSETDGVLVTNSGYDKQSCLFGAFDPFKYRVPASPTKDDALVALAELKELFAESSFVTSADLAATISALFTAVTRPSLPHAPAFNVTAPVSGSGKSFICEVILLFATPEEVAASSFPMTEDEAQKSMIATLATKPSVIFFDDMTLGWRAFGTINRMLTSAEIDGRILGVSKMAKVGTRALVLGTGNNVEVHRDLCRRIITIHIDPRCESPTEKTYKTDSRLKIKRNREHYIALVLTIIQAWKAAGSPKADVKSIATYGEVWGAYCRQPLLWLGMTDPASSLFEQLKNDPDAEKLGRLIAIWAKRFGSKPMTVRKVIEISSYDEDLFDVLSEMPFWGRDRINHSFGSFIRDRQGRIVNGLKFKKDSVDGRVGWCVVLANDELLPCRES